MVWPSNTNHSLAHPQTPRALPPSVAMPLVLFLDRPSYLLHHNPMKHKGTIAT